MHARLLRVLLAALLLLLAGVALLLLAALQPEPAVSLREQITHQDVARVLRLMRGHDPRRATPGRQAVAVLNERDLEVLIGHGAQRWLSAASRVEVQRRQARVQVSAHLPQNLATRVFGRWLNLDIQVLETGALPVIGAVQMGRLPVPVSWAERAVLAGIERSGLQQELQLASDVVQQVRFAPRQVAVRYAWRSDSTQRVLSALLPASELQGLRAYHDLLVSLASRQRPAWEVPLPRLLVPMFDLAQQRTAAGGDAVAENRAALIVLTLYVNGRTVAALAPTAKAWPQPRWLRVLLAGRVDFPQHFLVSAALAVESTGALSQAIGVYKEVIDSRGGSGFSFTDMAANRAGTRFGKALMRDPQGLQQRLARGVRDDELVPPATDLPEMLPEREFLLRFGGVGAPAYNDLLAEIDRRIDALALLR